MKIEGGHLRVISEPEQTNNQVQHKHFLSSADYINACARAKEASKPVLHLPPQKAAKPKNNAGSVLSDSHRSALTNTLCLTAKFVKMKAIKSGECACFLL